MTQHLFLLRELVRRDFRGRYAGSVLGFLWSFVQPLWQLLLFSFIFGSLMKISPLGERTDNFGVFLFCGLLPWTAFHEGIVRASTAITENASLVKKLNFPSELLILAVALGALLHEAIAAAIFVVVLVLMGELVLTGLPLLLVALPLQLALTLGLGLLLSAVHVFFRDTAQVVTMVFTGWFYFTPIVYPMSLVPERFLPWIEANPLTALVALYRAAFLGGPPVDPSGVLLLALWSVASAALGLFLFLRLKPSFADEI
ncbi:MAG: ABC transporter permease [Acidobacteriota bacterium]|nr:ABC transporter permease [Acidobacteriota bacterium]